MLVVASPTTQLKRINPAFGATIGYGANELVGTPLIDLVHPDDRARTLQVFENILGGAPLTNFENRYLRKDGEQRVFSWRANVDPVTGDIYAVARDVTQQHATEAQLRHAQKMEAVGQLAGGIAHDFNNLLLAILGNAELARQADLSPDVAEHIVEIEGSAQRAADLTQQLLAFSRGQPLDTVPIDINELVAGLMKMLRRLLPESITIDWSPGKELPSVSADPGQLEQVIVNLCVNARDAMPRGGRLTLGSEMIELDEQYQEAHPWAKAGRYVLLRVTDTGVGMTPEVRERAFEPFFTTKGSERGTGLGLATVYGIVQRHGGMIHLYSEPGHGTAFKIYLPADARVATPATKEKRSAPPRGDETILIAEDEEQVRRVVVRLLERAGYQTIAVANGAEALRVLAQDGVPVDLVLLDVVMPGLGGPETWEKLRELRPDLGVLFASGYADERHRERMPEGARVLDKPFRTEELLRAVREKLDERG
jgi:PAS domain S-box-containing protein